MAKIPLTAANIDSINRGFEFFFENGRTRDGFYSAGDQSWNDLASFLEDVTDTSGMDAEANYKSAKVAVDTINNNFTEGIKEEKEKENEKLESERPSKDQLETLEREAEAAKAKYQETIENSKKNVEAAIKKQQELHDKLATQQKKIYAKVEQVRTQQIEAAKLKEIEVLREAAKTDPQQLARDIAEKVKTQLDPSLKDQISDAEIDFIAQKTAIDTVKGLSNPNAQNTANIQTAIFNKLSEDTSLVPKIVGKESVATFRQAAGEMSFYSNSTELSRGIMSAIDKDLSLVAFGDPASLKVSLFNRSVRGFTNVISPDQLTAGYTNILQNQSAFFNNLGGVAQGEAKGFVMREATSWLEGQVSRMSPEMVGIYNNAFVQDALRYVGLGKPVAFGETGVGGLILKIPGASPFFEGLGKTFGIDFIGGVGGGGIGGGAAIASAATGTTAATVSIASTGGIMASEAFAGGAAVASATAGAAAGSAVPVVGTIIGAVVGFVAGVVGPGVISWLSDKYNKNKEMFAAIPVAGIVTVFWGPLAGLASGLGTYGLASYFGGGLPSGISSFISSTIGFLKGLSGIFLGEIAKPIIAGMIGLPIFIAFVLFIINSGAYVVPPSPIGGDITNIPPGGNLTKCDPEKTGKDITSQMAGSIRSGSVQFLPNNSPSRKDGICMDPTMIVLHTSGGYDNDDGNVRVFETLVQGGLSCQMATDTDNTILMLSFFENQVEYSWCADNLNAGGVSIEMSGEFQGSHGPFSKCSPDGSLTYTPSGPHPCAPLEDLAFDAVCKVMQKYSIPWTQVFQHEASNGTHTDPVGDAWSDKFILRLKSGCTIKNNDQVRSGV